LAGKRCSPGDTVTDVMASVLAREPEWTWLPATTPDSVRRLLRRCLQKDPRRRLHDMADARLELDDASLAPAPAAVSPAGWPGSARWTVASGALLLAGVGLLLLWSMTRPAGVPDVVRPQRLSDLVGLEETPALSPDGKSVAFTAGVNGRRQVFVQLLAGGAPFQLTHDPIDHQFPRWSPDSSSVVYFSPATDGDTQGT